MTNPTSGGVWKDLTDLLLRGVSSGSGSETLVWLRKDFCCGRVLFKESEQIDS